LSGGLSYLLGVKFKTWFSVVGAQEQPPLRRSKTAWSQVFLLRALGLVTQTPQRSGSAHLRFLPSVLSIGVSAVKVTMQVWPGNIYVLESSTDLQNWSPTGPPFTAQTNLLTQEFEIDTVGKFFRVRQVP
jgi:hypothetical protein